MAQVLTMPPRPAALLSFEEVWVEYGDKVVLERVSLQIAPQSFVSIVGPSGAGKSTFLRLITGQEQPTRGRVLMDGAPACDEPGPERGVVFQRYSVFPHLSALDNVAFGLNCAGSPLLGRLFGARRRAVREEAAAMLEAVGLQDAREIYPSQMSGGMQQRLAIAQALVRHPRVLLLDEPFGALDPGIRLDMHELILGLWQRHTLTILMVTHDIKEAFKLGTRVLAFDKRRRDPQAPHRYGATAVYDFLLDRKSPLGVLSEMEAVQDIVGIAPSFDVPL
ncbi:MAG: transporter ATP-binding protein [Caulobacteraceae bacterium]|nr:transporter ATP-binding protein [Caulobacteraceae bacterium]